MSETGFRKTWKTLLAFIHATTYVGRLGRCVNDGVGDETNAKMCKLGTSTPHLALIATKNIQIG